LSRYMELSQKAAGWTQRFNEHLEECRRFAFWMIGDYLTYMDAPRDEVQFIELDNDLQSTGKTQPSTTPPVMKLGKDDFWYFGLSVRFAVDSSKYFMIQNIAIGLQKGSCEWLVKWSGKNYKVPLNDLSQIRNLFDEWITMSSKMYEGPVARHATGMGFIPSV